MKMFFSKANALCLFFGLCFLHCLWSQQGQPNFTIGDTPNYSQNLATQTPENSSGGLTELPPSLSGQEPPLLNPGNPWSDLRTLIADGLQGLSDSSESLNLLELELAALKAETKEQQELYVESQKLLTALKQSLAEAQNSVDIAIDRMQDAEGYALWIDAQNIQLKKEMEQLKKSAPVGFAFGCVGFGAGTPLVVEGIRSDNRAMIWTGAGVAGVSTLVWAAGHYLFQWW